VAVKFLSEEWATSVTKALNSSDAFRQAAGSQTARIQNVVTTTEGEKRWSFKLENGQAEVAMGELPEAEATLTSDYDTAAAISKGELGGTSAFMSGRLRTSGDMMKLMQLQGLFGALPQALQGLEIEY
jgi:putative sterol carrier protein